MPRLKSSARNTHTLTQEIASRNLTSCALRWKSPRSRTSTTSTRTVNPVHNSGVPTVSKQSTPLALVQMPRLISRPPWITPQPDCAAVIIDPDQEVREKSIADPGHGGLAEDNIDVSQV